MILTNELLEEKYKAQKKINEASNGSLKDYYKNIHNIVEKLEKEKRIKFKQKELAHF